MSKININVIIKNKDGIINNNYVALKNKNRIIYYEKDYKTTIFLDNFKIIRENKDCIINMNFEQSKQTIGNIDVNNNKLDLEIYTYCLDVLDDYIKLKYKIITTNQEVTFELKKCK